MKTRYTSRAFADREEIFDYLEQRSPQGALNVMRAINNSIRRLEHFPYSAPATDEPEVRELIVPGRPYKVYYRIVRDEVWVVHIRHTSRRPWSGSGD